MAAQDVTCPMCGFKNSADAERCRSCGAKVESLGAAEDEQSAAEARRYQQDSFEWKWALVAFAVFLIAQGVMLRGMPLLIPAFDPQGFAGLMLSVGVWFVGGILVGLISPGKTFVEPAVGALITVPFTIALLSSITPPGFEPSVLAYIVTSLMGIMLALFGAFAGEKVQMMTR